MTPTTTAEPLLTEAEFVAQYNGVPGVELIDGKIVRVPMTGGPHGYVLTNTSIILGTFAREAGLGRAFTGDVFVRTQADPIRMRGADVMFVSYARLPKGQPIPEVPPTPELVFEVRSPHDRMGEYLNAGVGVVVLLDPETESASVHRQNEMHQLVHNGDELTLPDVLPGFAVPVKRFFE